MTCSLFSELLQTSSPKQPVLCAGVCFPDASHKGLAYAILGRLKRRFASGESAADDNYRFHTLLYDEAGWAARCDEMKVENAEEVSVPPPSCASAAMGKW